MKQSLSEPDVEAVARAARALGRELTGEQAGLLTGYLVLLVRWRRKINLVGPSDWTTMLSELVADSWHLADFLADPQIAGLLSSAGGPLVSLDFGAGAGLPGVPLRAFWNRGPYVLLEAREKRTVFLGECVARLGLDGVSVAEGRVEHTVPAILAGYPQAAVLCLSRAFAPWPEFLSVCRDLVGPPLAVVTMTGEAPLPEAVPDGFELTVQTSYVSGGKVRYLSCFASSIASM